MLNKVFSPGKPWLDIDGNRIQAHAGYMFYENDTFYWYGENKEKSKENEQKVSDLTKKLGELEQNLQNITKEKEADENKGKNYGLKLAKFTNMWYNISAKLHSKKE